MSRHGDGRRENDVVDYSRNSSRSVADSRPSVFGSRPSFASNFLLDDERTDADRFDSNPTDLTVSDHIAASAAARGKKFKDCPAQK